ncbi:multidrug ABC transporter ATPase [Candidatus Magnetoovum chiemensis]|nr:multidrug ABC transporter ATPase [Candidatus Magnetoovum chiemensis]
MIKVDSLEMYYGSFKALDRVSFEVQRGEIVGLLGPNGAGKSTTMKVLTTYLYPSNGKALIAGQDVTKYPLEVRSKIGYLPEILPLYLDMEVKDYLNFVGKSRSLSRAALNERIDWAVNNLGIKPVYRKLCGELSKGFRQRIGLAQALIHDPEIVILDEPTSGLDPHQIMEIRALIRQLGKNKTVILSTHILREAEAVSDRIVIINRGRIVGDGTVAKLQEIAHSEEKTFVSIVGDKDKIMSAFRKSIPQCTKCAYLNETNSYHNFELISPSGQKIWHIVGEIAKQNNWQLGLLKDMPHNLEETFMALTKEEK